MTSSHSLHAGTYLTSMPISITGEVTFHLLPKVTHLVNDSWIEYDSRCHSITPLCVITDICPNKKRNAWARARKEKAGFLIKAVLSASHVAFQNQLLKYANSTVQISSLQSSGVKSRPNMNHRFLSFFLMSALPGAEKQWLLGFCLIFFFWNL